MVGFAVGRRDGDGDDNLLLDGVKGRWLMLRVGREYNIHDMIDLCIDHVLGVVGGVRGGNCVFDPC